MTAVTTQQGITLEYEESGPRHGPPVLLIMGLGCQLSFWPEAFCAGLSAHGYRVIRFDNRVDLLKTITAPTLVIHGSADPLVPLAAGRDTAAHISKATLKIIDGMGHDLPPSLIPVLFDMITPHIDGTEGLPNRAKASHA